MSLAGADPSLRVVAVLATTFLGHILYPRGVNWSVKHQYLARVGTALAWMNYLGMICRLDVRPQVVFTSAVLLDHVESSPAVVTVSSASLRTYGSRR